MAKKKPIAVHTNRTPTPVAGDPHRFVFELDRAIRDQVLQRLEESPRVPLTKDCAPQESGIYLLYWMDALVYIGKASKGTTKSKRTLRARLNEHLTKLANRQNLTLDEMKCKFLTIESDWFVWAAEFALINHFAPEWNGSGYGSKVPGKGRPGIKSNKWADRFPLITPATDSEIDETDK